MPSSQDLFGDSRELETIKLVDADLKFLRSFYSPSRADHYFRTLISDTPWRQEPIKVWGKVYLQPRLTSWYGDVGSGYSYSGIKLEPLAWTPTLMEIKAEVEQITGNRFNSVLINQYRDQQDSVGWHSDDERELGTDPVIASLSLGETRTFRMKHKSDKQQKPLAIDLTHGSLLVMAGSTQQCWQHAVDKEREAKLVRINLTFRSVKA